MASSRAIVDFEAAVSHDEEDFAPLKYDKLKQDFSVSDPSQDIEYRQPAGVR